MFQKTKRTAATTDNKVQRLKISGLTEAVASSAQQRIYIHENLYFSGPDLSIFNSLVPLQIKRGSVLIEHIRLSLVSVIQQHTIFRTSIRFNSIRNQIEQYIQPLTDDIYSFEHSRDVSTLEKLDRLLTNESIRKHFDVENGKVLRCHVVQRSAEDRNDSLHEGDLIIFVIHHIAFDLTSYKPFLKAFERACWANEYQQSVLKIPQYIDFALYEQALLADLNAQSKMNKSRQFWANLMHGYDWDKIQHLVPDEGQTDRHRSGRGYSSAFIIDQDVVDSMMLFASTNDVTMFSLSLACYYAFLFKLTNHDDDLCIVSTAANRLEKEIQDMIAPASYAQARIWLDERIRFDPDKPQIAIYNMPFQYRPVPEHTLSIKRLLHALQLIVLKHQSLHTSLAFDTEKNQVMQRIIDLNTNHRHMLSVIESIYETDEQLTKIMHDEKCDPQLFNLAQGQVFRCHIVYYKQFSSNHLLSHKDLLIFNFHHALFDFPSMTIFLRDLNQAYTTGQLLYDDNANLRYIDYAVIEQQMSMTGASMFWRDALHNCKLDQALSLPFDRYRLANEHRTGCGSSISFDFGQDLSHHFLIQASSNNITLEYLALASYYVFLFKLTNGENDLCIGINTHGRYRDELNSIIGMFVNAIPLRCQLDPHLPFHEITKHVQENMINCMKYSYFPLQRILNQHPNISNPVFLDTSFDFIASMRRDEEDEMVISDSRFSILPHSIKINEDEVMSKFDFILSFKHDLNLNEFSCTINASLDLFNVETVCIIAQRLQTMLHRQFTSFDCEATKPIYELSLILSNEQYLMQSMNNTQVSFPSPLTCIHHEFVYQVMKHPQKLAVELDEQSLTYCELLYYVQVLAFTLLNQYHVHPGEVIGIMAIEMAGGVYCPLSPRDPQHRLHALMQQTQSRLVLVHYQTKTKFHDDIISLDIDSVLNVNNMNNDMSYNCLSSVKVKDEEVAYIIFTSGSTGTPKAVQVRHKNFIDCINSLVYINSLNKDDTVVQMTRCSFDIHVQEILGTLLVGGTLIMLRPGGTIDFDYLSKVLQNKQITYLHTVPTNCIVWNLYGPAEATIDSTIHCVYVTNDIESIPIGRPLSNYRSMLMNHYLQSSATDEEGELCVGGVGVFAGYLGRDDLTAKALIEIDGQLFYRTGDLVRIDNNGLLHYQGRKDHQIKLHGQRIELGEIERCLLNITSISACVVMKWNDDYLVAYVQSSHINEEELRQHCQSHLPPHMIPSIFIILDKLPLNPNGKIDRKQLPPPHFSSTHLTNNIELLHPTNDIEISIHRIWCEIFKQSQISTDTNIFTIGGHSLIIIQLFHRYKIEFQLETNTLSISNLFQHSTIIHHAQLIQQSINIIHTLDDYPWSSLHIAVARASFAQERIYLDEQIRFSSNKTTVNNMYVIPLLYRISSMNDHVLITRLYHAFQTIITKHNILRTALYIDDTNSNIIQQCLDANIILDGDMKSNRLVIINLRNNDRSHMNETIEEILNQADLFDLSKGRVIRCHILRHYHQSQDSISNENDDLLTENDHILISIHHAMFDGASTSIFLHDLSLAYESDDSQVRSSMDENTLKYIDYSVQEHIMDMSLSREFWHSQLEGYNPARQLSLPVDRQRSSTNHQRSGLASIAEITFDSEICTSFLNYASSHHLTPFQLGLSIFYVFLFKLSHGETDLCISSINANRYRNELQNMIGMFVSTLPYRAELDPHWSFNEVVKHVREKCLSILEHSHYPLQHILGDNQLTQSNVSFLEIMFDFITVSKDMEYLCLNDTNLKQISLEQSLEMSKFDFSVTFEYNSLSDNKRLSCSFVCSRDLFEKSTISQIAQRFEYMFEQLFQTQMNTTAIIDPSLSIDKLSLILSEEAEEMELVVFHRLENIVNEAPASFAQARIWLDERIRFDPEKPQVAIYNMPFIYRMQSSHTLSVKQLHQALQITVDKHLSLHTSLTFDAEMNMLMQRVITRKENHTDMFSIIESTYETDEQLNNILHDEKRNPQLFNLAQGLVFRCHIIYYQQVSSNDLLSDKDVIIFNFHYALFDFPSMQVFHHDLNQAYTTDQLLYDDNTSLRYLDYAVIEQQMSMTGASMFWLDALHNCKLDQALSLPYDRYRLSNEHRTDRGTSISFHFGQDLSHYFLTLASSNNISLEHLTFAIYFIFLFKITNGQMDLCIGINTHGRYRNEFNSIIGLFENVIPLRCQLDPHWCFHQLLKHVQEITTKSMKYSYFPLQRILNQHPDISKHAFLDTSLEFLLYKNNNAVMIGDSQLVPTSFSSNDNEDEILTISDFSLSIYHDMNMNQLSCTVNASLDLFNTDTVENISQRFYSMSHQLSTSIIDNQINKPIYELSLTLSNEQYLVQSLNNTQISFLSPLTCIHHEFVYQVMKHPQKLAVELDEQSLTYCELLYYVQVLSLTLLNEYLITPGEIVCQCVERSLSMVIGIMGIEMAGGVYCPLSPRDPQHRLHALTKQTQSRLVLVHHVTKSNFSHDVGVLDIDSILIINELNKDMDYNYLSSVTVKSEEIAYTIFTSGSTGTPKAVQVRHKNFTDCMHSLAYIDSFNRDDTVVQMTRCSFDVHVQEILGTLLVGGSLIMLHPGGTIDFNYLSGVLQNKKITYLHAVPSLLHSFFVFIEQNKIINAVEHLRSLCSGGESFSVHLIDLIAKIGIRNCIVWNTYGPAEATIDCAVHRVNVINNIESIPIGRSLSNYRCMIINEYLQLSAINQEGELFVGGVGVFAGYLGRDDLTAKALVEIDGQLFYQTGDLVTMDNNGLLHYHGRKDHQIKLHGQRIELGEIERCLLSITSISACVVIKWNDDYLVAYVQNYDASEQELREHCQSHLPPHMIPSIFIILDKLPLNANGKVDRKLLPSPHFSSIQLTNSTELILPANDIEVRIHHIWCDIFKQNQISIDTNIFTIGGHSLLMMQLFHRYKIEFHLETSTLSISNLFQHPTIIHHAQFIQQSNNTIHTLDDYPWSSLHIVLARASFAQERIYLDEQIRFSSNKTIMKNMYVIPLLYRISSMNGHISISRLQHAFQSIIKKHKILRTALHLDDRNGNIIQHCLDANIILNDDVKSYGLTIVNLHNDDRRHMNEVIEEILNQANLFDLSKGHVIRCHILRHCHQSQDVISSENDDLLTENDHILISIHHAMFDGASVSIFTRDLSLAYQSDDSLFMDANSLQYIDYSTQEHIMDMTLSREFWHSQLERYNIECSLSLPVDRQRSSSSQQRSGLASTAEITFDNELCTSFLNYASSHHLTLFQLGLSIFYVFLFKLAHGESDLCISSINANRYRSELVNMIGMFVSTLPYRAELDPHWSFDKAVKYVQEKCLSILEHSHYPLQYILADLHVTKSNISFLETMFDFITLSEDVSGLCLNGVNLEQVSLNDSYEIAKFDFSLTFVHNPSSDGNQLSCCFVCTSDIFDATTAAVIGIMGIEMTGGVYCPLSPRDPQYRLYALTQRAQSRLVLVHHLTKTKFKDDIVSLDIDSILNINNIDNDMSYNCISSVKVRGEEIAYIIFTSGSTGTPKAVQVRHKNFIDCMHSLVYINSFNEDDTVVQMTRCSFDIHVQEILGTLLVGGTLIMLHPNGTIDFDYLSKVLENKQITYLHTVPSLLHSFLTSVEQNNNPSVLKHLRSLCSSGEPFSVPLIDLIVKIGITNCVVWNLYGPAETTIDCTFHRVNVTNSKESIPIGIPLSNYRCMIINQYLQSSVTYQEGELFVGGVGVFVGYLGRDDLTAKALIEIDGQLFYRTGDLVRIDNNCLLHYQGRKDHQIKLRGQRIELGEIERCLLNITSISACVVMKWNDDYLVAYVQSSDFNEEELRQHCQSHLPSHMIPSYFIILEKLPLNPNGKIDRKQLPSPNFSLLTFSSSDKSDTTFNQFEDRIHTIWCQVLHCNENHISGTASFFSAGGHSLRFIELYYRYQSLFNFDTQSLSIGLFLLQPTIRQHAQLLQTIPFNDTQTTQSHTLHINQASVCCDQ
ncbi:unnamed protein product [Adineta steineri]|uniref:Carrier domain-containing protein n=1 Tax=Adineta steineri TaxID=433720 RepID=A0A815LTQ9_9BILA|nr:unnamed protein product [Adineta steineri]CAF1412128.1 unnamed protein product [Adineta steineri]